MPEILTESFCERCGTRYTFESAAPRKTRRLGQFRTLSKGLKNYVMSDDTSMDEAMAAARGDDERQMTSQQLDAFHATFNFCMNCRQYTCGNCWNSPEGRCLTCAPLGHEILSAPFPGAGPFEPAPIAANAWPTIDLSREIGAAEVGANGNGVEPEHIEPEHVEVEAAAPEPIAAESVVAEPRPGVPDEVPWDEDDDPGAHFSFLRARPTATPVASRGEAAAAAPRVPEPVASADVEPTTEPPAVAVSPEHEVAAAAEAEITSDGREAGSQSLDEVAASLASRTSTLLGRFRPGQNIDAELAAYEAGLSTDEVPAETPEPASIAAEAELIAEPGAESLSAPVAIEATDLDVAPEPAFVQEKALAVGATAETEVASEPEPAAAVAEPEPATEPIAASAEAPRDDQIEQPTWRIFAPDQATPTTDQPPTPVELPAPPAATVPPPVASVEPQWPGRPEIEDSPSMALLANSSRSSSDALWAASAQQVLARPATGPAMPTTSVQPCSNCGLSLSATARFCRRCGTRQG
jgi:hypothetical protein